MLVVGCCRNNHKMLLAAVWNALAFLVLVLGSWRRVDTHDAQPSAALTDRSGFVAAFLTLAARVAAVPRSLAGRLGRWNRFDSVLGGTHGDGGKPAVK